MSDKLFSLISTGGPGASRFFLLSIIVLLNGSEFSAAFSSDIYVILILNLIFCQSFAFFFLKEEYRDNFWSLAGQSCYGLILSVLLLSLLGMLKVIAHLIPSLVLLCCLHFYFMVRFKNLADKRFVFLSFMEIAVAIVCIGAPFITDYYGLLTKTAVYYIYAITLLVVASLMLGAFSALVSDSRNKVSYSKVRSVAIANTVSSIVVLSIPALVNYLSSPEMVTLVALALTCLSIIFLIPRAYANTFLPALGARRYDVKELIALEKKFFFVVVFCAFIGIGFVSIYLSLITQTDYKIAFTLTTCTCFLLATSQLGFVVMNHLMLHGHDRTLRKVHLKVLAIAIFYMLVILFLSAERDDSFVYILLSGLGITFLIRGRLAFSILKSIKAATPRRI